VWLIQKAPGCVYGDVPGTACDHCSTQQQQQQQLARRGQSRSQHVAASASQAATEMAKAKAKTTEPPPPWPMVHRRPSQAGACCQQRQRLSTEGALHKNPALVLYLAAQEDLRRATSAKSAWRATSSSPSPLLRQGRGHPARSKGGVPTSYVYLLECVASSHGDGEGEGEDDRAPAQRAPY
jgi:hypothetical protein